MLEEELFHSIDTAIERVNSAVWARRGRLQNRERSKLKAQGEQTKKKEDRNLHLWAGKGLALYKDGTLPKADSKGYSHSLNELIAGALRGYAIGFALKGSLNATFALLQRKGLEFAFKQLVSLDTRQFARFVGAFCGIFRFSNALLCIFNGKDTPHNSFLAGGIASISILFDEKNRRQGIALYLFVRAVDVWVKKLVRLGFLPYWEHFESFLFGVVNMPIMYGFLYEPSILQHGYYKWILGMGNLTHDGIQKTLRDRRDAWFIEGRKTPFCNCSTGYHDGPCAPYVIKDWFWGLGRAGRIYLPVHLLPLLIFRWKLLLKSPVQQFLQTSYAFLCSCMFLTTYQSIVKAICCFWRNRRQRDEAWQGLLAGFLTMFSTYFERKSRISELMLYCWPRGLEATWEYLRRLGWVVNIPNGEVGLFCIASAILMSAVRTDFRVSYHKALCFLIGTRRTIKPKEDNRRSDA